VLGLLDKEFLAFEALNSEQIHKGGGVDRGAKCAILPEYLFSFN
jgi:hypothetical protein